MSSYSTGTATDEQDLVNQIDTFMTGTLGWVQEEVVTDTGSTNDRVYSTVKDGAQTIYVRFRGNSDILYTYGYSRWAGAADFDDEIYDVSSTKMPTGSTTITYWLFGTQEWIWVVIKNGSNSNYYSSYGGYANTYYSITDDTIPLAIVGMALNTYTYTSNRCFMYSPTQSGIDYLYIAKDDISTLLLAEASPNVRDGSFGFLPVILYSTTAAHQEVRGELYGVYQANGAGLSSETFVTISGTTDQLFIVKHSGNTNTYGYGPIPV